MVEPLAAIAQELVVPGLDLVLPNTVVPLETNSAFVAAYLAGLNTEMGRELVWRGFPADLPPPTSTASGTRAARPAARPTSTRSPPGATAASAPPAGARPS